MDPHTKHSREATITEVCDCTKNALIDTLMQYRIESLTVGLTRMSE